MKTVFQRALSVIMCVILVVCTMSTVAFAATDFTYDRFKDPTPKSVTLNADPVLDVVDDALKELDIYEKIVIYEGGVLLDEISLVVDLTSIDKICETLDSYRGIINLASNDLFASLFNLGDIKDVDLSSFEEGLSRAGDGDVKVLREFLELANANGGIIEKLLAGTLDLGVIGSALDVDLSTLFGKDGISGLIKELIVGLMFEGEEYNKALATAKTDFDKFIYVDVVNKYLPGKNFELNSNSTVDDLIKKLFDLVIGYLKDSLSGVGSVDLSQTELKNLDGILILDGSKYNFDDIKFNTEDSVLKQINKVLGEIFIQLVPSYEDKWITNDTAEDYKNIADNVEGLFRYLAETSGCIDNAATLEDEPLMVEVIKLILRVVNFGEYEDFAAGLEDCTTLKDMAKMLTINIARSMGITTVYKSSQTYEHVLGDILIELLNEHSLIATPEGKECKVGDGYDVWTVANYFLNFYFDDKNLDSLMGKDGKMGGSLFNKLDVICDMFASDGTSSFETEKYLKDLIESVFTLDIATFVELTAVKALNFAGDTSAVKFIYNGLRDFLYNWAGGRQMLPAYAGEGAFQSALENENIATLVKSTIAALSTRAEGLASALGLLLGLDSVSVSVNSLPAITYTGSAVYPSPVVYGNGQVLQKNVDYQVVMTNNNNIGTATATVKGIGAYTGEISVPVKIVFGKLSGLTAKPVSTSSVTLSWSKLAGAKSYNIYNGSTCYTTTANSYTVKNLKPGTRYTFRVEAVSSNGTKSAQTSVNTVTLPAQVTGLKASTPSNTQVKLTWNKVPGATGYYVQSYTSGAWKTVATVSSATKTLAVSSNTAYTYRVIAYSTNSAGTGYNGAASSAVSVRTAPGVPSSFAKKSVSSNSVTLSWKAVPGVTGYEIYDGNGKKVGTTKSAYYTVKSLKSNTTYKYRIRAYVTTGGKTYTGNYTSFVSVKTLPAAPTGLKVKEATATSLKLTWNKVSGATKYYVAYYNGKKWVKINAKTKNYVTITDLKANTTYKVKVCAYIGSTASDYTAELNALTAPSKGTLKSVKAGSKKATVSWRKVSGVTGYEVQYATSSSFKSAKTVTVKKSSTVSTTIKNLKSKKKYYVRVRAYKVVNGEKLVGKYSEYKTVTVK